VAGGVVVDVAATCIRHLLLLLVRRGRGSAAHGWTAAPARNAGAEREGFGWGAAAAASVVWRWRKGMESNRIDLGFGFDFDFDSREGKRKGGSRWWTERPTAHKAMDQSIGDLVTRCAGPPKQELGSLKDGCVGRSRGGIVFVHRHLHLRSNTNRLAP
jgi:hypothetical protein